MEKENDAVTELGELVVSGMSVNGFAIFAMIMGVVCILFFGMLAFANEDMKKEVLPQLLILIFGVGAGLAIFIGGFIGALCYLKLTWFLHERGARVFRNGKERILHFNSVDEITLSIVRYVASGRDFGTLVWNVKLACEDIPGKPIEFMKEYARTESDLKIAAQVVQICNLISSIIAQRFDESLERVGSLRWNDDLTIKSDGIEITKQVHLIQWPSLRDVDVHKGKLRLWIIETETPTVFDHKTDTPNFWPFFMLLRAKIHKTQEPTNPTKYAITADNPYIRIPI